MDAKDIGMHFQPIPSLNLRTLNEHERIQQVWPVGEALFTTDTNQAYMGDGETLGGVLVTWGVPADYTPRRRKYFAQFACSTKWDHELIFWMPLIAGFCCGLFFISAANIMVAILEHTPLHMSAVFVFGVLGFIAIIAFSAALIVQERIKIVPVLDPLRPAKPAAEKPKPPQPKPPVNSLKWRVLTMIFDIDEHNEWATRKFTDYLYDQITLVSVLCNKFVILFSKDPAKIGRLIVSTYTFDKTDLPVIDWALTVVYVKYVEQFLTVGTLFEKWAYQLRKYTWKIRMEIWGVENEKTDDSAA
jgi:hypothetical protein